MGNPQTKQVLHTFPPEAFLKKIYAEGAWITQIATYMKDGRVYSAKDISRLFKNVSANRMANWLRDKPGFVEVADLGEPTLRFYYLESFAWFAERQGLAYPRDITRWAEDNIPRLVEIHPPGPEDSTVLSETDARGIADSDKSDAPGEIPTEELPEAFRKPTMPKPKYLIESGSVEWAHLTDDYMLVRINRKRDENVTANTVLREIQYLARSLSDDPPKRANLDKLVVAVSSLLHTTKESEAKK